MRNRPQVTTLGRDTAQTRTHNRPCRVDRHMSPLMAPSGSTGAAPVFRKLNESVLLVDDMSRLRGVAPSEPDKSSHALTAAGAWAPCSCGGPRLDCDACIVGGDDVHSEQLPAPPTGANAWLVIVALALHACGAQRDTRGRARPWPITNPTRQSSYISTQDDGILTNGWSTEPTTRVWAQPRRQRRECGAPRSSGAHVAARPSRRGSAGAQTHGSAN